MSAYDPGDDLLTRLGEMLEALERLSLEQKISTPQREKQFDELVSGLAEAIRTLGERERRREHEARLEIFLASIEETTKRFLDAFAETVANGQERLATSEQRLAQIEEALLLRSGPPFEGREELEAEGQFLAGVLGGPPTASDQRLLFKDAPRRSVPAGIDVLARAVARAGGSTAARTSP